MVDRFSKYHPLVNFLYFTLVIGFSMALNHPLAQGISLVCACLYAVQAEGKKAVLFTLKWCLPIMLLTAFLNPAFSHESITILLYFPTGNPLTLESILYGLSAGVMYLGNQHYNITAILVLIECMVPFFLVFESRKSKARELVTIAVLCAIAIAGWSAFFMLPQFKPVLALVIISGVAFGGETGFLAGVLFRKGLLRRSHGSLATFGAFAAVIIYGGIRNPAAALMYNSQTINWEMLKAYYVSGLPMDLIHAAATAVFILIAAEPMLEKLDRIKVKYGLVE